MWTSKYITLLASLVVGITFAFSGLAKLNNPRGFAHKIEEYLHLLVSQLMGGLRLFLPYTVVLALIIAIAEVVLGTALLIYWQRYWTLLALLSLTLFFTALTLYTATSKHIASCGCFGDALELTPWQSFGKSIILLLLLSVLYWRVDDSPAFVVPNGHLIVLGALLGALGMGGYKLRYLPIIDWGSCKVGDSLATQLRSRPSPNAATKGGTSDAKQVVDTEHDG